MARRIIAFDSSIFIVCICFGYLNTFIFTMQNHKAEKSCIHKWIHCYRLLVIVSQAMFCRFIVSASPGHQASCSHDRTKTADSCKSTRTTETADSNRQSTRIRYVPLTMLNSHENIRWLQVLVCPYKLISSVDLMLQLTCCYS